MKQQIDLPDSFDPRHIVVLDWGFPDSHTPGWIRLAVAPSQASVLVRLGTLRSAGRNAAGDLLYRLIVSRHHRFELVLDLLSGKDVSGRVDYQMIEAGRLWGEGSGAAHSQSVPPVWIALGVAVFVLLLVAVIV